MLIEQLPIQKTGYWSETALAYLSDTRLKDFYSYTPELSSFRKAIQDRKFPAASRQILHDAILRQYADSGIRLEKGSRVPENIESLLDENTYTVTAGQQIHIFLGPLFVLYKTITAIKLAEEIQRDNPGTKILPVFWMASEDHDLEEINKTQVLNESFTWEPGQKGAVGRMDTSALLPFISRLEEKFAHDQHILKWLAKFASAYREGKTLARASRILMHELFGEYGLLVLDPDDKDLKSLFTGIIERDITTTGNYVSVTKQSEELTALGYQPQVNPREINHFYLDEGIRERIVNKDGRYQVLNSDISFSEEELLQRVKNSPEKFSPNVIMRPLYQETILPDLAYIPGGSELVYWLQLKTTFEANKVFFPVVWPRVSVFITTSKKHKILDEMQMQWSDLFLAESEFRQLCIEKSGVQFLSAGYLQEIKKTEQDLYQVLRPAGVPIKELVDQFKKLNEMINRSVKQAEEYFINRNSKQVDRLNQLKSEITFSGAQERKQFIVSELLKNNDNLIHALMQDLSTILGSLMIVKI